MARCCWRRRMPPDTAVAVPATTVVVAAAPMRCMPGPLRPPLRPNGGISVPFLGCSCVLERCVDHSQRRSLHIEHHAVRRGNSVPEARRPDVLPHENGGRGVGLQPLTDGGQVIAVHEIADLGLEPLKRPAGIGVEVLELERGDIAVAILLDEGDVQDPNGLRLHQFLQSGYQVPRELVAWKGNDQVLHRADRHLDLLRRSVSPRARRRAGIRTASLRRPAWPVVTRGDGHPGEPPQVPANCQREQPWRLLGEPSRGRGWLVRGHEAAAAARMTGGWTDKHFLPSQPGGGSCVLRVCWHDSGGWPGYTPERGGKGIGLPRPGGGQPGLSRSGRPMGSVLIGSKLVPPTPAGLMVPRDQLVGWLASGKSRLLTLVCAPAGYGKTTLLAQWCQAQPGGSSAWVNLDKGDSDPVRFWTYLICAIAGIEPAVGRTSLQALSPQPDRLIGEALPRLLSELDEETREIALVLDDFHLCENEAVAGSLAFFAEHKPARVQVVVSCRSDPRLPLGRLRANGQLLEIRAEDLRFDDREAEAFFTLAGIGGLSSGDIQSLSQRAEGWPAALRLAAILLPAYEDRSGFARDFAGSNRQLADYMVTDVLAALPEAARAFLLRTCVLERLTAPLCDALTGAAGSGVILRELSRAGLFITPVDATAEWYRYHQLFSGALRAELQITDPDLIPVLHARASCWFEQDGDLESATEHAIRARDLERSSRLVIGQLQPFIAIGRIATIERWLGDLSWPQAQQHPELAA